LRSRAGSPRFLVRLLLPALAAVLLGACTGGGSSTIPSPLAQDVTPSEASPTPPALPDTPPPTSGVATDTCQNGWETPAKGSQEWDRPLDIIRRTTDEPSDLVVVDMRMFVGPESPPSHQGYLLDVQRWYVKLFAKDDLAFQGRFLVEKRVFGSGLSAVAAYDTNGYRSPDWVGFQWSVADHTLRVYPTLPGRWEGTAYDFVRGGAGLELPGLPAEVAGCMDGT
jgi:hypothetical protein